MKIGSSGKQVKTVQKLLLRRGYTLPRFGADGDLGSETWAALFNFSRDHGLVWDEDDFEAERGVVPASVVDALEAGPSLAPSRVGPSGEARRDANFFDITGDHALLKGRKGAREPETVHTIVLHQTAVKFGTTKANRERFGERKALHRRFHNVACHVAAVTNGDVLYVNRLPAYVWHAHVANRFSVGIEVDGLYAGIEGDPKTVWGAKRTTKHSEQTIEAARRALRFTFEEGLRLGMPLTWIAAHRNYSASRMSDPGEWLWQEVALWGVSELGLRVNYETAQNGGRPVPVQWDPSARYDYRGKPL